MTAQIIDGKKIAAECREALKAKIASLHQKPSLAVIQVGDNPASSIYVHSKEKACTEVGIISKTFHLTDSISEDELLELITDLNKDNDINGILVQLPLPKQLNEKKILEHIDPIKDVDGFHPVNTGLMIQKSSKAYIPCTPKGIIQLIKSVKKDLSGLTAVVIGRSLIVGIPTAHLLLAENCTVTIAHSKTKNLPEICRNADILVAAVGKAELITEDYIKPDALIIDVGINRTEQGLKGDVKRSASEQKAAYFTPVPGGVGPMTIAMLLENTYEAYLKQQHS